MKADNPEKSAGAEGRAASELREVCLALIDCEGLQTRATALAEAVVDDYAAAMRRGETLPPIDVFCYRREDPMTPKGGEHPERFWLADGWHRCAAARRLRRQTILARVFCGGHDEALRHALRSNEGHGLRLTTKDKRFRIEAALKAWPNLSSSEIARRCGVTDKTVTALRSTSEFPKLGQRMGADGRVRVMPRAAFRPEEPNGGYTFGSAFHVVPAGMRRPEPPPGPGIARAEQLPATSRPVDVVEFPRLSPAEEANMRGRRAINELELLPRGNPDRAAILQMVLDWCEEQIRVASPATCATTPLNGHQQERATAVGDRNSF